MVKWTLVHKTFMNIGKWIFHISTLNRELLRLATIPTSYTRILNYKAQDGNLLRNLEFHLYRVVSVESHQFNWVNVLKKTCIMNILTVISNRL